MANPDVSSLTYLLLQIRNADDPMKTQEIDCFARALDCGHSQIRVTSLLEGPPTLQELSEVDAVLLGGSGDYSVAAGGDWLEPALVAMRELYDTSKPTFASCWGFQAMAKALGGEVITDMARAELGTLELRLTEAGQRDPLFAPLGSPFLAPEGHQDCVVRLPDDAILLASSPRVANQAFRIADKPIYCTQFHPELDKQALLERLEAYPTYIQKISGMPLEEFARRCHEPVACNQLLQRFAACVATWLGTTGPVTFKQ